MLYSWRKEFCQALGFSISNLASILGEQLVASLTAQSLETLAVPANTPLMAELNTWEQKVINEILSSKDPLITSVKNVDLFAHLFFNRNKYKRIVDLINAKNWEEIKSNDDKCETDFQEDLTLVKFTNQDDQSCLATIYDSDELWQDPKVIDIFVFN